MKHLDAYMGNLYDEHLEEVLANHRDAMGKEKIDVLVIDSGGPEMTHYDDDHGPPAPVAPNFARLAPVIEKPNNHVIVIGDKDKPTLLYHMPQGNFWQKPDQLPPELNGRFNVIVVRNQKELEAELKRRRCSNRKRTAWIGPKCPAGEDPQKLKGRLDYDRRFKTDFEIRCIGEAVKTAASGHLAAKDAFSEGDSELEMHLAFLNAADTTDDQLAFPSIVSLDANTAYLHRSDKDPKHVSGGGGRALIDAGTRFLNYDSDITTTWVEPDNNVHEVYIQLLAGLENIQKALCEAIKLGVEFTELHKKAHLMIAMLLKDVGILRGCSAEQAVENRYTTAFFPHGLGHLLGIQAHDKGGKQKGPEGGLLKPPSGGKKDPLWNWLRKLSPLAEREVVTIEPGIYFFPDLLAGFRSSRHSVHFNWDLIDQLDGGMRIESDILVLANGFRDMTAEALERKTNV